MLPDWLMQRPFGSRADPRGVPRGPSWHLHVSCCSHVIPWWAGSHSRLHHHMARCAHASPYTPSETHTHTRAEYPTRGVSIPVGNLVCAEKQSAHSSRPPAIPTRRGELRKGSANQSCPSISDDSKSLAHFGYRPTLPVSHRVFTYLSTDLPTPHTPTYITHIPV